MPDHYNQYEIIWANGVGVSWQFRFEAMNNQLAIARMVDVITQSRECRDVLRLDLYDVKGRLIASARPNTLTAAVILVE